MKGNNKQNRQEFQYLSDERIQEVYRIYETFQETDWTPLAYRKDYLYQRSFRDINKPFKKFSILKRVPLKTISTS